MQSAPKYSKPLVKKSIHTGFSKSINGGNNSLRSIAITVSIILTGIIIVALFQEQITELGVYLLDKYGQERVDLVLFLLTAISSSPLTLPIWNYALIGIALGYSVWRLAAVMAIGSAMGSFVTYCLGRYFGNRPWVKKKFSNIEQHPWTEGESRRKIAWLLFIGTASPLPCDVFYFFSGVKGFPPLLFLATMVSGRFVRYVYLGYLFLYFPNLF